VKRENKGHKSEVQSLKETVDSWTQKYELVITVKKELEFNINELNAELENSED